MKNGHFSMNTSNSHCLYEDIFSFFPIGLIVIHKVPKEKGQFSLEYMNTYARELFSIRKLADFQIFKSEISKFKKWENNHQCETNLSNDIFNNTTIKESNGTYISSENMIYVKIKRLKRKIFICVDNFNDERKQIQSTLSKSLKYQFLLTLYHELYNPMNALITLTEGLSKEEKGDISLQKKCQLELLIKLIKFFLKNIIWYIRLMFEIQNSKSIEYSKVPLDLEQCFIKAFKKFQILFDYKEIRYKNNFTCFNGKYVVSNKNYFSHFIKTIHLFLYYIIPNKGNYEIRTNCDKKDNICIKLCKSKEECKNENSNKDKINGGVDINYINNFKAEKTVHTIEIAKDVLIKLAEFLKIKIQICPNENTYINFSFPYINQSQVNESKNVILNEKTRNDSDKESPLIEWIPNSNLNTKNNSKHSFNDNCEFKKSIDNNNSPNKIKPLFQLKKCINIKKPNFYNINSHLDKSGKIELIESKNNDSFSISNEDKDDVTINILESKLTSDKDYGSVINEIIYPKRKVTFDPFPNELTDFNKGICECNDVLICDDEKFNLMAIRGIFKRLKITVDQSYNGQECLNKIKEKSQNKCKNCNKNTYKLLILDIVMPVMDGIEASKKIQGMIDANEIPKVTIILISALIDDNIMHQVNSTKCVKECVLKPIKAEKLKHIIQKYYYNENVNDINKL